MGSGDDLTAAFVEYAGQDLTRWQEVVGQTAVSRHKDRGLGTIIGVGSRHGSIVVCMKHGGGRLVSVSGHEFARVHSQLTLPASLEGAVRAEAASPPERKVARPAAVPAPHPGRVRHAEGDTRLARVRAKAASGLKLELQEIKLLGETGSHALLSKYLELRQSQKDRDYAHESQVCSFWRTAGLPQEALAVTAYLESRGNWPEQDKYAWTCRAAALADMYEKDSQTDLLAQAARCAENALRCDRRSVHAYNGMGRIRFLQGDTEEADHCYRLAEELAGDEKGAAQMRRNQLDELAASLRKLDPHVAAKAILRLMKLDPVRYEPLLWILPAALRDDVLRQLRGSPPSGSSLE